MSRRVRKTIGCVCTCLTLAMLSITTVLANGTEILGPPDPGQITIATGNGIVHAGVGTANAGGGSFDITVPAGVTVNQVIAYWGGETIQGTNGDDEITIEGNSVTGDLIGGPTFFFSFQGNVVDYSAFRQDITGLNLIPAGATTNITIEDMDYIPENSGVGLLVIYEDPTKPATDIGLFDGVDLAFFNFPGDRQVTVPRVFTFPVSSFPRLADLRIFAGSIGWIKEEGIERPNIVRIKVGGGADDLIVDALRSVDGLFFDSLDIKDIPVPAGVTQIEVELISPDQTDPERLPASVSWIAAALQIDEPYCGDGNLDVDLNETCDPEGSATDNPPELCRADCTYCGDGNVDVGEMCDPADPDAPAGCRNDCTIAFCGDETVNPELGETCDPEGSVTDNPPELCRGDCTYCGDGNVDVGEMCDPADPNAPIGCRNDCTIARCGDTIVDPELNETCDPEGSATDNPPNLCRADCTYCGDGNVDVGEMCDPADPDAPAGCRNDCTISFCGDETVDPDLGETCDPEGSATDNPPELCREDCTYCGDGLVNGDEDCDPADPNAPVGCRNDCTISFCGDNVVDPDLDETCDPEGSATDNPPELCREDCTYCGDGNVDDGEDCDPADPNAPIGCQNDCTIAFCGDNMVNPELGETCDPEGSLTDNPPELCREDCTYCGDGIVDDGEECDPEDPNAPIGCQNDCTIAFCGDNMVNPELGETCDPEGSLTDNPPELCREDCTYCGDGIVDDGEECDPEDPNAPPECQNDCTIAFCGDNMVNPELGETCDPEGSLTDNPPELCREDCTYCGDGIVDDVEECDPADPNAPPECQDNCTIAFCGDNVVNPELGETCDPEGSQTDNPPELCREDCTYCGDGILDPGEVCDPRDPNAPAGCPANCQPAPAISIEKLTNGFDADDPNTDPVGSVSPGAPVTWTYVVTNTGNVPLTDVGVVDSEGVLVTCPMNTLAVLESMNCTGMGVGEVPLDADECPTDTEDNFILSSCNGLGGMIGGEQTLLCTYTNTGTASGTFDDTTVDDDDPSSYCPPGIPDISIEKATNGLDADDPNTDEVPSIGSGELVTWTYEVTNTGNVVLTDVSVVDSEGVTVTCPQDTLAPGESMTCTADGPAEALPDPADCPEGDDSNLVLSTCDGLGGSTTEFEQITYCTYTNLGTATGDYMEITVDDDDPSSYCPPADPAISIEKSTNGFDADDPNFDDLATIAAGEPVDWNYLVTNTGNVGLTNVSVVDSPHDGVSVSCPQDTLAPEESMRCTAEGTAEVLDFDTCPLGDDTGFVLSTCNGLGNSVGDPDALYCTYVNLGTATGEYGDETVDDEDPSSYCPPAPECDLTVDKTCCIVPTDDEVCDDTGCDDCDGKITALTLRYVGGGCDATTNEQEGKVTCRGDVGDAEPISVRVTDSRGDRVYANTPGVFLDDDVIALASNAGEDDFTSESKIVASIGNQTETTVFHTSCSKPISVGDQFGSFLVVSLTSTNGGTVNLQPADPDVSACIPTGPPEDQCDGRVIQMIFEYTGGNCGDSTNQQEGSFECDGDLNGQAPASIEVTADADAVFVSPDSGIGIGDPVAFNATGDRLKSNTEFDILTDTGAQSLRIHTSCSKPLSVGDVFGGMKLISLTTTDGGTVTLMPEEVEPTSECSIPAPEPFDCDNKIGAISFRYVGGTCDDTTNQQSGAADCDGEANSEPVRIIVYNGGDTFLDTGAPADVDFDEVVRAAAADKFPSATFIDILNAGGDLVQELEIHTSCSKPIDVGDQFGALVIDGLEDQDGNGGGAAALVEYTYVVTNEGLIDAENVVVSDDMLGPITDEPIGIVMGGESVLLRQLAIIEDTVINTVTVSYDQNNQECPDVTATATVTVEEAPETQVCSTKVQAMLLQYTGPAIAGDVTVEIEADKFRNDPVIYNLPELNPGDVLMLPAENGFSIDATAHGEEELGSKTALFINGVEEVLHTSCSTAVVAPAPAPLDDPKGDPSPTWFLLDFEQK